MGLGNLTGLLAEEDFTLDILIQSGNDETLKEVGVKAGPRLKLMEAIQAHRAKSVPATAAPPTVMQRGASAGADTPPSTQ